MAAFTRRALDFFLDHGIVAERLMSDNAFAYIHTRSLQALLQARAISHLRTAPLHAAHQRQGRALPATLQREWAYALEYASSEARRASLPHWVRHYNDGAPTAPSATDPRSTAFATSPGSTARPEVSLLGRRRQVDGRGRRA